MPTSRFAVAEDGMLELQPLFEQRFGFVVNPDIGAEEALNDERYLRQAHGLEEPAVARRLEAADVEISLDVSLGVATSVAAWTTP